MHKKLFTVIKYLIIAVVILLVLFSAYRIPFTTALCLFVLWAIIAPAYAIWQIKKLRKELNMPKSYKEENFLFRRKQKMHFDWSRLEKRGWKPVGEPFGDTDEDVSYDKETENTSGNKSEEKTDNTEEKTAEDSSEKNKENKKEN